jgi:hypothetical protein
MQERGHTPQSLTPLFPETIMAMIGNENQDPLSEDENDEAERGPDSEPDDGGTHAPSPTAEPRIKNN